jgi:hypothetical protein
VVGVWFAVILVLLLVPSELPNASGTSNPLAGSQGTVITLASTSSAVTVNGTGEFANLSVTVNQTQDLENQAVLVSWTGGTPTLGNGTFDGDYLQIFQCWGDPTDNGGPPPTQCEFGGESGNPSSAYPVPDEGREYSRVLSQSTWSTYPQQNVPCATGNVTGAGSQVSPCVDNSDNEIEPFVSVDGTVVDESANYGAAAAQPFWLNPYFSFNDTNEVDFARTYSSGDGQQLFEVDTGVEAPGLGCGESVQTLPDGSQQVPDCWLVVVPRGTPAAENPSGLTGVSSVVTSPLNPLAWANRIAIPLQFNPVNSTCGIAGTEQRIVGSELASAAISSWEPALCASAGAVPYNYSALPDDQARSNILQPAYGSAGLSVFSDPIDPSQIDSTDPVTYAPLTLSGVVIGFNVDRAPALQSDGTLQADEVALDGSRVINLDLTPLLVAKLLTESYQAELQGVTADTSSAYSWIEHNPTSLVTDPDFLQYNPEFTLLTSSEQLDAATLVVEESSSDAAAELWNWIFSDPEAEAWLDGSSTGEPSNSSVVMKVNPFYSTNPSINPSGVAFGPSNDQTTGTSLLTAYPKSDPYTLTTGNTVDPNGSGGPEPARPLGVQDWSPYALTMNAAAQDAASSNDGGKTTLNVGATPDAAWTSNGPQPDGSSFILSVTDSASAAQFGLQTASLSPSGDDTASRPFVAPDQQSLLAGEQAMDPSGVPGVLKPNPGSTAPGAYPLPLLTYAAAEPESLDAASRQNYAKFLQYAAGAGQTAGVGIGQLPPGYAPLPAALQAQSVAAAATILNPPAQGTSTTTTTTTTTPTSPSTQPVSSPSNDVPPVTTSAPADSPSQASTATRPTSTTPPSAGQPNASATPGTKFAVATSHYTPIYRAGVVRWLLPIDLLVGALATLGIVAAAWGPTKRRKRITKPDPADPVRLIRNG